MDSGTTFAFERVQTGGDDRPGPKPFEIVVLYTSIAATIAALRTAGELANKLRATITLLVMQHVPYPLPLASPPVLLDFSERRFRTLAGESKVETRVKLFLCRDASESFKSVLMPRSIVVIGGRRTIWPTAEKRLARRLRRLGHEVIVSEKE